ncbi:MAG: DUF4255 domain-containing protein [Phormidesmis sp.]
MSNALAIAAVTTTLRNLLSRGIGGEIGSGGVTTKPPDKARDGGDTTNQLNLFLYRTHPNPAWQNRELPSRVRPGETGAQPLALNLYYLITAYGQNSDDLLAHQLLGLAMQTLHDNAFLNPADIRTALAESDLQNQIERVKLTPMSLNLEEISKMWATFQTQYRISAAYEASVVLIESRRATKAPLPILSIGSRLPDGRDAGIITQANVTIPAPPFPTLTALKLPAAKQPSIQLGELLTLQGHRLQGNPPSTPTFLFRHPRLSEAITLSSAERVSAYELQVVLDPSNPNWLAGTYGVSVAVNEDGQRLTTNLLPFSLAPKITLADQTIPAAARQLRVRCEPAVWLWRRGDRPQRLRGQQVSLLLGNRELLPIVDSLPELDVEPVEVAPQMGQKVNQLTFDVGDIPAGEYFVRLRVDGIDSLVIDWSADPLEFNSQQRVTLQ